MNVLTVENEKIKQIDFYCRKCKKSMKMTYELSGEDETPVFNGMVMRCHTNKCKRVMMLKNYTEGKIKRHMDEKGKCYI